MSTNDVPGAKKANKDILAANCWAEAADGSIIVVRAVEGGQVVYDMYDFGSPSGPEQYMDSQAEPVFKKAFSWSAGDALDAVPPLDAADAAKAATIPKVQWTWHDKTPVPWDRILGTFTTGPQTTAAKALRRAAVVEESRERLGVSVADPDEVIRTAAQMIAQALNLRGDKVSSNGAKTGKDIMKRLKRALRGAMSANDDDE